MVFFIICYLKEKITIVAIQFLLLGKYLLQMLQ